MTREEAIALLAGCKPLADKLAALGTEIELTDVDRSAVAGFIQVLLYDEGYWLEDTIHREAGLNRTDIVSLSYMATVQTIEKMERQHIEGEPLV